MKKILPVQKIRFVNLLLATILSLGLSLFVYLFFLQSPLLSKREYAFAFLVWIILTPLVYLLLTRFLIPALNQYTPRARRNWLLLSVAFCIFLALFPIPPQLVPLLPRHTVQIDIAAGDPQRSVALEYFTTSLAGDISFSQFTTSGEWQRIDSNLLFTGTGPSSLSWSGRTGESITLVFKDSPTLKEVQLRVDGRLVPLDSIKPVNGQVAVSHSFPASRGADLVARIILGFTAGLIFLVVTLFLAGMELKTNKPIPHTKGYWLLYTLPMIAVWVFFLFIFFPGMITQDSTLQWEQGVTGHYVDVHPIFFALLIKAISQVYNSPAAVVLAQIIMLSLSLAWGMSELERMGCPRIVLWVLSALCAILPINILGAIVLRKDIPYSAAVLALAVIFLKLINSNGDWLKNKWNWLGLGLILGVISLSRINGVPLSVGSLILILLIYRQVWHRVCAAAGVFLLMLLLMYGPIYSTLKVKHASEYGTIIFLHHIAAHLAAGTPLDSDQARYLSQLAPLDGWDYDCCTSVSTVRAIFPDALQQVYDLPILKQDIQKPTRIALSLFLKDPAVDIRHMVCAGQIVWNLNSSCQDRIVIRLLPLELTENAVDSFSYLSNLMGFKADPLLPGLIQYANPYLQVYSKGFFHWINFTSAFYLYLAIYCTGLAAYRRKSWRLSLFLAPILLQSLTLLLITISQAYRYQYSVVLVGLLSLGFLFFPDPGNEKL